MSDLNSDSKRNLGAIILIVLGVLFLLSTFFNISALSFSWPLFIIIPGAIMLFGAYNQNSQALAIPGAITTGTGIILWFQAITDHWESWAYAWALYPVFTGLAIMWIAGRSQDEKAYARGRQAVSSGLLMFIGFGLFFELLIFGTFSGVLWRFALPIVLIGGGAYLLFRDRIHGDKAKNDGKPKRPPAQPTDADGGVATGVNPNLQRQIDEALAEDDPDEPKTTV